MSNLKIRIATKKNSVLNCYDVCCLIALNKGTRIQINDIGEVLRRNIGRSIVKCVIRDCHLVGANIQMRFGHKSGIKHALRPCSREDHTDAIIATDAENEFDNLN